MRFVEMGQEGKTMNQIAGNRIAFLDGKTLYIKTYLGGIWSVEATSSDSSRATQPKLKSQMARY
jgi:hypothetical protein